MLCLGFTFACKHDIPVQPGTENPANDPGNDPVDTGQPCDPTKVYFQRDILPILATNCTMDGCHNANDHQDGVVLDSYSSVMNTADVRPFNANGSDLYEVLEEDKSDKWMPYGRAKLPQAQRDLIRDWINQGAKNEICGTGTCDSVNVTYSQTISPIIQTHCLGCHNNNSAAKVPKFTSYAGVAAVAQNGKLVGAITRQPNFIPMPQVGKLTACQISQIRKWVNDGALNN